MRVVVKNKEISVRAIAGTQVVLLGLNAEEKAAKGLLGFSISRRKGNTGTFQAIGGNHGFEGVASEAPVIQAFQWGDYTVEPKTTYTYRVTPLYGTPKAPVQRDTVELTITTEDPEGDVHGIYFNRGVAGSQAYARKFGSYRRWYKDDAQEQDPEKMTYTEFLKPQDVPNREAFNWLSRGLEKALLDYIAQADGPSYSLRAAIYELTSIPVIQAFVDALERGVDVQIVHHAKRESVSQLKQNSSAVTTVTFSDSEEGPVEYKKRAIVEIDSGDAVCRAANDSVARVGVREKANLPAFSRMLIPRTITQISHNKFIVLLKDGEPVQVWTGSTNLTDGGIFGQSNVGHIVRDPKVAKKYYEYWQKVSKDPKKKSAKTDQQDEGMKNWTVSQQPDLVGPPPRASITPVFSPRLTKGMLDWYAERLDSATSSVFFTAAFSVADEIYDKVVKSKKAKPGNPYLRYLLLEGKGGLLKDKYPEMAKCKQNRIAWGETLRRPGENEELETLSGLNENVNYLHTKYMLVDPLSDDPIVITGSANFSTASTMDNDENMLIIRGNTRVADVFLTEFMRLFNHFRARNELNKLRGEAETQARFLTSDDSWATKYFTAGTPEESERLLFS